MTDSYVHPVKKANNHRAAKIVTAIVVVLLIAIGVIAAYLFKDDNAGLSAKPSAEALKTILADAVTGKESELTATQVNELLAYKAEQQAKNSALGNVYLTVNSDNTVNAYVPVTVKGMHFGITANMNIAFDSKQNAIAATVKSMHIGRLGVPVSWAMNLVKDKLPAGLKADGDKLTIESSYLAFPIEGANASLTVSDLEVKNGKFLLKTTGMTDVVKSYLAKAGDLLQGLFK